MKLDSEFYRLPLTFDAERMLDEVNHFKESDWMPHPTGFKGNESIPLISVRGEANDEFNGTMLKTPFLNKCAYIQQVISSFDEVFGRSRLMKLGGGNNVLEHSDLNYHWYSSVRIHIPIITFPEVKFHCGSKSVHMAAGETWIFDSWKMHKVINPTEHDRIHLVIDTSGSSKFWDMVKKSDRPHDNYDSKIKPKFLSPSENNKTSIKTERFNVPEVMSPGEVDALCVDLTIDASTNKNNDGKMLHTYVNALDTFRHDWRAIWSQYGQSENGLKNYRALIQLTTNKIKTVTNVILSSNSANATHVFYARILHSCININSGNLAGEKVSHTPNNNNLNNSKVGRNSLCPCGSGKKYKRCHGR